MSHFANFPSQEMQGKVTLMRNGDRQRGNGNNKKGIPGIECTRLRPVDNRVLWLCIRRWGNGNNGVLLRWLAIDKCFM